MKFNYEFNFNRIKELRLENNLKQKDIAQILGVSIAAYSQFERNETLITIEKLNILSNYYQVSLDYLLGIKNNKEPNKIIPKLDKRTSGINLKNFRKKHNLYQDTLASVIGTGHSLISEYESGKRLISLTYAYAICKKYNITMYSLYSETTPTKIKVTN